MTIAPRLPACNEAPERDSASCISSRICGSSSTASSVSTTWRTTVPLPRRRLCGSGSPTHLAKNKLTQRGYIAIENTISAASSLGIPTGADSPVGPRLSQLAVLIAAREIDQQYEWSGHEPAALKQGLEQSVIDVVKHNKDVAGLSDKDATLITFGRTLLREHKVSSELWQKMVGDFGRQHTIDLMAIMGDYTRVGIMLNAVDQHLPADRTPLLPPLRR